MTKSPAQAALSSFDRVFTLSFAPPRMRDAFENLLPNVRAVGSLTSDEVAQALLRKITAGVLNHPFDLTIVRNVFKAPQYKADLRHFLEDPEMTAEQLLTFVEDSRRGRLMKELLTLSSLRTALLTPLTGEEKLHYQRFIDLIDLDFRTP